MIVKIKDEGVVVTVFEILAEAIISPLRTKQRSALAILGIIIGAASITAMLSTGYMAERETLRQFEGMGVKSFVINANGGASVNLISDQSIKMPRNAGLDQHAIDTLKGAIKGISFISPLKVAQTSIVVGTKVHQLGLAAVRPSIRRLAHLQLREGRFLADIDDGNMVVVLGSDIADQLRADGHSMLIGKPLRIGHYVFTIIGVLASTQSGAYNPIDFDKAAVIPLGVSQRAIGDKPLNAAMGIVDQDHDTSEIAAQIKNIFQGLSPREFVDVQSPSQLIQALKAQRELETRLLSATSAISLIVGGVGIMNVMLMNVLERRREIGLRAAVGATPRQIQFMFLIESSMLSGMGGFLGCSLGVIISAFVAARSGWQINIPLYVFPVSLSVAIVVGILFGSYPAIQASKLNPVEALRYE